MGSKVIRNITKVFRSASGVLFGRATAGTGRGEELTPSQVRSLISVYSTTEVDSIIGGIGALTAADIDTLAEINAILTDADVASVTYVDSGLSGKQATLVSGTNIKTINSTSLLGSGNIAISASPAGTSGQVQYNNAGAFGGMTAVVYAATGTHVAITSQAAATIPLYIKGAASQSGNLQEWQNSSGTVGARIAANCTPYFPGTGAATGNTLIGGAVLSTPSVNGNNVGIGTATLDASNCVSIGFGSFANWDNNATAVGAAATCRGNGSFAGGSSANVGTGHVLSVALAGGVTTASNQFVCAASYNTFFASVTSATPQPIVHNGCGGSGTNIAGGKVTVAGGKSTGNATPAIVALATTTVTTSGITVQTLRDVLACDGNTTSGETPVLVLDCAKGTLQRVSTGASDSGGTGFKVLRIPN